MLLSMIISRMIYGLRIKIIFPKRKMNTLKRRRMSVPLLADVKIQRRSKKETQSIKHKKFSGMIYGLRIRIIFLKRKMTTLKRRRMSVPLLADVKIQRRGKKGTQSINHKKFSGMIYGLRIGIIFLKRKMTTLKRRRMSVPLLAVKKIETRSKKITRI
ncbi:hypothetical protein [Enterococcus malodoratus]|uniref:hypothetical protein n=1 Tax=Enterococcus malodoratus TaxID=71451 RepID=UPI0020742645|nr:hypothetical protein [Enterococcus malodoratus]